jgi:hypothetical protein
MRPKISPGLTVKLKSSKARMLPNTLTTDFASTARLKLESSDTPKHSEVKNLSCPSRINPHCSSEEARANLFSFPLAAVKYGLIGLILRKGFGE